MFTQSYVFVKLAKVSDFYIIIIFKDNPQSSGSCQPLSLDTPHRHHQSPQSQKLWPPLWCWLETWRGKWRREPWSHVPWQGSRKLCVYLWTFEQPELSHRNPDTVSVCSWKNVFIIFLKYIVGYMSFCGQTRDTKDQIEYCFYVEYIPYTNGQQKKKLYTTNGNLLVARVQILPIPQASVWISALRAFLDWL